MGTTLVFSADGESVVAEAGTRRDARRRDADVEKREPVGATPRGKSRRSPLDLPDTDPERGGTEGGGRPN
jgi:hypothetical protein